MVDVTYASSLRTGDWITYQETYCNEEEAEYFRLPAHVNRLLGDVNWIVESEDYDESLRETLDGLYGWVRHAVAAHTIKLKKLYTRAEFKMKSFAQFCKEVLELAPWSVNQQIEGAFVVIELAKEGFKVLPKNAAQARVLRKYVPTGELTEKWRQVLDKVQPHELTVKKIQEILEPQQFKPKHQQPVFDVPEDVYREMLKKSASVGMSPQELFREWLKTFQPQPESEDTAEISAVEEVEEVECRAENSEVREAKPILPHRNPSLFSGFWQPVVKGVKSAVADIGGERSLSFVHGVANQYLL